MEVPEHKEDDGRWVVVNGVGLTQVWLKGDMTPVFIEKRRAETEWRIVYRDPTMRGYNNSCPPVLAGPFEELDTAKVHYLFKLRARVSWN
jgi:hypothetical protein